MPSAGRARRSASLGRFIYVAAQDEGVQIVDDGDPDRPVIVGSVPNSEGASDVTLSGDVLCIARGRNGVLLVDVSRAPQTDSLSTLTAAGLALGLAVDGTTLYIVNDAIGLQIVDISDPATPRVLGGENTVGEPQDVVVAGAYAYVSDLVLGLRAVTPINTLGRALVCDLVDPFEQLRVFRVYCTGSLVDLCHR